MSSQILVTGSLAGAEDFLSAAPADRDNRVFDARIVWLTLLGEVLPRALLRSLELPAMLLGSSGGGRFLVILPDAERAASADAFLSRANESLQAATGGAIQLIWSTTENLGDWTVVRKRLAEGMQEKLRTLPRADGFFDPFTPAASGAGAIPRNLREAKNVGFSFELPALISSEGGDFRWDLGNQASADNIALARHASLNGDAAATPKELALRGTGARLWGVLRGEIDGFGSRLRRAQSVEEHVHLSILFKQFLSGEIELLSSTGDFFRRVTVLDVNTADFAIFGSWDALADFARQLERIFGRFVEENLKEQPGAEAKTITMSLTLAEPAEPLAHVWAASRRDLAVARSSDKDCFHILGSVLEWKQWSGATELKDTLVQINQEFRGGKHFLTQLGNLYKKVESPEKIDNDRLMARAIRFQRRFSRVASRREREFQKLRTHLVKQVAGRQGHGKLKLKPEGLVALEWARLISE